MFIRIIIRTQSSPVPRHIFLEVGRTELGIPNPTINNMKVNTTRNFVTYKLHQLSFEIYM